MLASAIAEAERLKNEVFSGSAARIVARSARLAGEGRDHETFRPWRARRARFDDGGRSRRRRSQRHGDGGARRAALRPRAAPSTARPRRARRGEVVLHPRLSRRCRRDASGSKYLTESTDGFELPTRTCAYAARASSRGTLQSGAAETRLGDLVRDVDVYRAAKVAAEKIVAEDPNLARPEHAGLRAMLESQPQHARAVALVVSGANVLRE